MKDPKSSERNECLHGSKRDVLLKYASYLGSKFDRKRRNRSLWLLVIAAWLIVIGSWAKEA